MAPPMRSNLAHSDDFQLGRSEFIALMAMIMALQALGIPGLDRQVAMHWAHNYGVRALRLGQRLVEQRSGGGTERLDRELPYLYAEVELAGTGASELLTH